MPALVHGCTLGLERLSIDLVDRSLAGFELLSLLDELLGVVELASQLVGARVVVRRRLAPQRPVGHSGGSDGAGDPGGAVSHQRDATLPRLPASPSRRSPRSGARRRGRLRPWGGVIRETM